MENKSQISKVGRYPFLAEPFHCDVTRRLFLGHLGNHLLNAADFHSDDCGFGMTFLNTIHKTWVLSRLAIEMTEMPDMYDKFFVETWMESAMRYFTSRNFKVEAEDGKVYGYGRSIWAMIDTDTRQPTDLMTIRNGDINNYIETDKPSPIAKLSRVKMDNEVEFVRSVDTYYSDVDINGHINSVKYIEHILDLWSLGWYKSHRIQRFEIAYVAECHQGDRLNFYREQTAEDDYCIRITKTSENESENVEVVRSKVEFVKD